VKLLSAGLGSPHCTLETLRSVSLNVSLKQLNHKVPNPNTHIYIHESKNYLDPLIFHWNNVTHFFVVDIIITLFNVLMMASAGCA
jgi:hypothetical protein